MIILFKLSMFIFFEIDMPPRTRGGYTSSAPRRRPTGSERRRRVQLREVEPAADPDSVEHPRMIGMRLRRYSRVLLEDLLIDVYCGVLTNILQRRYGWER